MHNMVFRLSLSVLAAGAVAIVPAASAHATAQGFCRGLFHDPHVVNGLLEWGASDECEGGNAYPHSIRVELFANGVRIREAESGRWDNGNSVVTVYEHNDPCVGYAPVNYEMRAYTSAAGERYQYLSEVHTVDCELGVEAAMHLPFVGFAYGPAIGL